MVPINEVLIAKIVLGYLSSRNLATTAESFLKESEGLNCNGSGKDEKQRILNSLEGMNLLPSLEDIMRDYFAYQGPDDTTDKVYMLWKQLDVVVGQLRAMTLGKSKTKAFICSRTDPKSYSKLVERNDRHTSSTPSHQFLNNAFTENSREVNGIQRVCSSTSYKNPGCEINLIPAHGAENCGTVKENIDKTALKSPKRKRRAPRKNVTFDLSNVKNPSTPVKSMEVSAQNQMNDEFSEMVAALISNDSLPCKLADKINQVALVDPKSPFKENDSLVDEVIRATADDPDLNILFSMLGGYNLDDNSHNYVTENSYLPPFDKEPNIDNEINSIAENCDINTSIQSGASDTSELRISISNSQPTFTELLGDSMMGVAHNDNSLDFQNGLVPSSFSNLINMISPVTTNQNESSLPSCIRSLDKELYNSACNTENLKEQFSSPDHSETLPNLNSEEETTPSLNSMNRPTSIDPQESLQTVTETIEVISQSHDFTPKCDSKKVGAEESVILASHALLQLSTSPCKVKYSKFETDIARELATTMTVVSAGNSYKPSICSTNSNITDKPSAEPTQEITFDESGGGPVEGQILQTSQSSQNAVDASLAEPMFSDTEVIPEEKNKSCRKKRKKSKMKSSELETKIDGNSSDIEEILCKKSRRSKDIVVTQLDFCPQNMSIEGCYKTESRASNITDGTVPTFLETVPTFATSTMNSCSDLTSVDINIPPKIVVTDQCDVNSPAFLLHAKLNSSNKTQNSHINGHDTKCFTSKAFSGDFQTFRITGNDISKVCTLGSQFSTVSSTTTQADMNESKTVSKIINNTDSLSKVAGNINFIVSDCHVKTSEISNESIYIGPSASTEENTADKNQSIALSTRSCRRSENNTETPDVSKQSKSVSKKPISVLKKSKLTSSLASKNKKKEKMTVKFKFKSPKKKLIPPVQSSEEKHEEEETEDTDFVVSPCIVSPPVLNTITDNVERVMENKDESLPVSQNSSFFIGNQENITRTALECLKTSCLQIKSEDASFNTGENENITTTSDDSLSRTPDDSLNLSQSSDSQADARTGKQKRKHRRKLSKLIKEIDVEKLLSFMDYD